MKTILSSIFLLLSLTLQAQVRQLADFPVYAGVEFSNASIVSRADSALISSAVLYQRPGGAQVESVNQPTISRSGRILTISWSRAQTETLPTPRAWLEIKAGGQTRYQAWVNTSKRTFAIQSPNAFTALPTATDLAEPVIDGLSIWLQLMTLAY